MLYLNKALDVSRAALCYHPCYHPVTTLLHLPLEKTVGLLCCDRCYTCDHPLYVCIEK